jgi:translation initiation factor IF-3
LIERRIASTIPPGRGPRLCLGPFVFWTVPYESLEALLEKTSSEVTEISDKRARVNDQIRISPVRLIQDDGEQIGIVSIDEARERAEARGMDLVEVAADARPPVVKMMDYGKYRYEEARATREARKKQHTIKVKEVKFRPGIEEHDYKFKVGHARRFLDEGNKVKLTMMFRGRQVTHPEIGLEVLSRVTQDLVDIGQIESHPNMEGRIMSMVVAPLKTG